MVTPCILSSGRHVLQPSKKSLVNTVGYLKNRLAQWIENWTCDRKVRTWGDDDYIQVALTGNII